MRRLSYVLALATSFMLLLSIGALANGVGDYTTHITNNLATDIAYVELDNTLEIWFTNDAALTGMSPAIQIDFGANQVTWQDDFIQAVSAPNTPGSDGQADVIGFGRHFGLFLDGSCWTQTGFKRSYNSFNGTGVDELLIGGAVAFGNGFVAGGPDIAYELYFSFDTGIDASTICINPFVFPPAGTWTFVDAGGYAPSFNGQGGLSQTEPIGATPVCYDVIELGCIPPVWTATPPAVVDRNHCMDYDFQLAATEGGNPVPADPVVFGGDATPSGAIHVAAPGTCGTDDFNVTATNDCGGSIDYNFSINWTNNDPSIDNCTGGGIVAKGNPWSYDFDVEDPDACDNFAWGVTAAVEPIGGYSINAMGVFTFNTDANDCGETPWEFTVTVTDDCGATDECTFSVLVLCTEPFTIHVEKTHQSLQGHYEYVSIIKEAGSEKIGGFDILLGYDASALSFMSAEMGSALTALGWEFFEYRYGAFGNCGGPCPSGYLRLTAIADQNNGPNHPSGFEVPNGGELAELKFYVTNDRTYECMYAPIRFVWQDCGDNGFSNIGGDTLFISQEVYDFEWDGDLGNFDFKITGIDCNEDWGFVFGGACEWCDVSDKTEPVRFIYFWNGGIDIACADSIDRRGDLNLNGIDNEIADAVLYTNYFLYGIVVFDIAVDGQIAASDVNNDGLALSLGDLVYLIRIITGDALPFPKLAPFAHTAEVNVVNGVVTTDAASELGGVFAVYNVSGAVEVISNTDMEVVSHEANGELRVLVYSGLDNKTNRIPAGTNELFTVVGEAELVKVEVADYSGNVMNTRVAKTVLPTNYALLQNTPNPFNPTTKITLELPTVTDWNVDIYNVAGQLVTRFNGTDVGVKTIEWNADGVASGIYFYKATAGNFTDTKKMVLMK